MQFIGYKEASLLNTIATSDNRKKSEKGVSCHEYYMNYIPWATLPHMKIL